MLEKIITLKEVIPEDYYKISLMRERLNGSSFYMIGDVVFTNKEIISALFAQKDEISVICHQDYNAEDIFKYLNQMEISHIHNVVEPINQELICSEMSGIADGLCIYINSMVILQSPGRIATKYIRSMNDDFSRIFIAVLNKKGAYYSLKELKICEIPKELKGSIIKNQLTGFGSF